MCDTSQTNNHLGMTDKNHPCVCATDSHATHDAQAPVGDTVIREHYFVTGMTCSHCVARVTDEVSALDGVESVHVALQVGQASRIMVASSHPVPLVQVRDAVAKAGYSIVTG